MTLRCCRRARPATFISVLPKQLGLAPADATPKTHKPVRALFKTVVLGIQYGLGPRTLALQTGVSLFEAAEILARLRARFRTFENFVQCALDHAGLLLEIGTPFGWTMQCPPGNQSAHHTKFSDPIDRRPKFCTLPAFWPSGAAFAIVATVHDALMAEADLAGAEEMDAALESCHARCIEPRAARLRAADRQASYSARRAIPRRQRRRDVEHGRATARQARGEERMTATCGPMTRRTI